MPTILRLTTSGRMIVRRERNRKLVFPALGVDLDALGFDAFITVTHPVTKESEDYPLAITSGDDASLELDGTAGVFPVEGTWMAKIWLDDGNADPEYATEEFPIEVLK